MRPWPPAVRGLLAALVIGSAVGLRLHGLLGCEGPRRASPRPPALKVDPNTAPGHVLEALPQIGPALAGRILAQRQVQPFATLDDLRRVRGIGPATLAKLAPHLTLEREPRSALSPPTTLAATTPGEQPLGQRRRGPAVR